MRLSLIGVSVVNAIVRTDLRVKKGGDSVVILIFMVYFLRDP